MPQNKISIRTSRSPGSRRAIVVEASDEVAFAAAYALLFRVLTMMFVPCYSEKQVGFPYSNTGRNP
jgi:hypothetical protein